MCVAEREPMDEWLEERIVKFNCGSAWPILKMTIIIHHCEMAHCSIWFVYDVRKYYLYIICLHSDFRSHSTGIDMRSNYGFIAVELMFGLWISSGVCFVVPAPRNGRKVEIQMMRSCICRRRHISNDTHTNLMQNTIRKNIDFIFDWMCI